MPTTTLQAGVVHKFDDKARLDEIRKRSVTDLLTADIDPLPPAEQERHRLYLLLLMRLVRIFWNGNRRGPTGTYPSRTRQLKGSVYGEGKAYLGHNIAAIAVEDGGKVIDFDFNHNDIFRSSVEHGEARLIQRMFRLTGLRSTWEPREMSGRIEAPTYEKMFEQVSIYTTLEPCAQCTGIMALARIKEVIYLQPDDGAMRVANVLYNLRPYNTGVKPIVGTQCGIDCGTFLSEEYERFKEHVFAGNPFWVDAVDKTKVDKSPSLANFLCTDPAYEVFDKAAYDFDALTRDELTYPDHRPGPQQDSTQEPYSNHEVLTEAKNFVEYASRLGHRGTPH